MFVVQPVNVSPRAWPDRFLHTRAAAGEDRNTDTTFLEFFRLHVLSGGCRAVFPAFIFYAAVLFVSCFVP